MKKNISINISGIIFHIEEDGYETLRKYLDSINSYFGSFEDSTEILADIESRIAEIFLSRLNDGKQVVTSEDVAALIGTMGNVNDFKAAEEQEFAPGNATRQESNQSKSKESTSSGTSVNKKLFRDEKRKILGGVSAGFAHYFNIDPVWPRLLFALLTLGTYGGFLLVYIILWIVIPFSLELEEESAVKKMYRDSDNKVVGGVASGVAAFFGVDITIIRLLFVALTFAAFLGVILYVILWIALPEAKTITEKMQMQGEALTLSNIESTVKKGLNEKENQDESTLAKIILFPFRLIAMVLTGIAKALGPVFKVSIDVLRILIGVFITLLGVVFILSLIFTFGIVFGLLQAPQWMILSDWSAGASNFPLEAFRNSFSLWTVAFAFLVTFIPCLFITLLGNSIIAKKIVFNSYVGWTLFVLFFVSLAFMAINVPRMVYEFKEDGTYKTEKAFILNGKTPYLKINETGMNDYDVTDLNLKGYEGQEVKLVQHFEAQGSSRKVAIENAQMVEYNVIQRDSSIIFDSNITFKKDAKFRAQRLKMDLFIPYNMPFVIEEDLWRFIHYKGTYYDFDRDNVETWRITTDGLECLTCDNDLVLGKPNTIVSDEFGLTGFNSVDLRGVLDVRIERGDNYAVKMEGSEKVKERYDVSVDGETLVVKYDNEDNSFWKRNFSESSKLKVTITMPTLRKLEAKGAGEIRFSGFDEDEVDLELLGAVSAEGQLSARTLNIDMTGATQLELKGSGNFMEADITGACQLKAYNFKVKNAVVEARGASSAKIFATESIEKKKGLASSITHRGDPAIVREED